MDEHDLFQRTQHGFIKGDSCFINLLEFFVGADKQVDQDDPRLLSKWLENQEW